MFCKICTVSVESRDNDEQGWDCRFGVPLRWRDSGSCVERHSRMGDDVFGLEVSV
jgi:hypothetical protein